MNGVKWNESRKKRKERSEVSISVFNTEVKNTLQDPMFFGPQVNTSRFDVNKYPIFNQLTDLQQSFFWRPEEVNLSKDVSDFNKLKPHEQHIFTQNLLYQTLLDSINGRAPVLALLSICSLPELESWILAWTFFENCIHSKSYSHIIRNVYTNPTEVLDGVIESPEIIARAENIAQYQDKLINMVLKYDNEEDEEKRKAMIPEMKKALLIFFFVVLMLEAVRFYISFSCSWGFSEGMKLMEGNAKIIKFIARKQTRCGFYQ